MLLAVRHTTRYTYSQAVFLGSHVVRLKPVNNANQRLVSFGLHVNPAPAGRTELVDIDGNESTAIWFTEPTSQLELVSEATVETLRTNAFDYLWQGHDRLPLTYSPAFEPALAAYRHVETDAAVVALGNELATAAGGPQSFLTLLASTLCERIAVETRQFGDPREPAETLGLASGSCRDLTVLYMAVARQQGFAARFATGYAAVAVADAEHELHAWAEVYVPGGGWRGFDPSTGLAVTDRHILIAAGARADNAATVTGSYRGCATSTLTSQVNVSAPTNA